MTRYDRTSRNRGTRRTSSSHHQPKRRYQHEDSYSRILNDSTYGYSSYSSAAVQPVEHTIPRKRPARTPAPAPRREQAKKPRPRKLVKPQYIFDFTRHYTTSAMTYVITAVVFICAVMIIITLAATSSEMLALNAAKNEYQKLQNENANLSRVTYENYDLVAIEQRARNDLGMIDPREQDKVYLTAAAKENVVVQYDIGNSYENKPKLDWASIFNIFN